MKAILTSLLILCSLPLAFAVDLEWDANPPADAVLGYNIYRSEQQGAGYAKLNQQLILGTSYTDATTQARQTYYYVATAVNSNGESGFSNEVDYTGVCLGEVNGDGVRNVLDTLLIMNHIAGNLVLEGLDLQAADVNEDGAVNVLDILLLQNYLVGNIQLDACN